MLGPAVRLAKAFLADLMSFAARSRTTHAADDPNASIDNIKISQGLILTELHRGKGSKQLKDYEFKVFSQSGEDGILQHLIGCIEIKHKTFIEFGVQDFFESNCRFLLMKDNWIGFVLDSSANNIERLINSYFYWKYQLTAIQAFVTRDNINELLARSGLDEDLGILSIDIDGNDYYVFEAITGFKPRILVLEYNAIFGPTRKISVPYDGNFVRTEKHYSNLYFGASLAAITDLANTRGYSLVGTNSTSSNAFFLRNDLINDRVEVLSAEKAYVPSLFRESRDHEGNLTFLSGNDRLEIIRGLPVYRIDVNRIEPL